jgi:hypothetical protein
MRDSRPCPKCKVIQCFRHCNNCGAEIIWRPKALDKSIPYTGPKPLNKVGETVHDRCMNSSKGVGPGERNEMSYSMQLFQFLMSPFNPVTGKFMGPHKTLTQLKVLKYNARNAPAKIKFREAFWNQCHVCGEHYSAVNRDCPICYDLTELGVPLLKPGVEDKKYGNKALIEWGKNHGKKLPLNLIMRNRKESDGEKKSIRSFRKEKGWGRRSTSQKEGSEEKEKSEKVKHAW